MLWVCSIIHPQSHHLVVMKMNLEDQDQVRNDQRRIGSTSPAETNTLAKVKTKPMALYHSLNSLAIWRIDTSKTANELLQRVRLSSIKVLKLGYDCFLLLSSLLQCYIFDNSSCTIIICWIESRNNVPHNHGFSVYLLKKWNLTTSKGIYWGNLAENLSTSKFSEKWKNEGNEKKKLSQKKSEKEKKKQNKDQSWSFSIIAGFRVES